MSDLSIVISVIYFVLSLLWLVNVFSEIEMEGSVKEVFLSFEKRHWVTSIILLPATLLVFIVIGVNWFIDL